MTSTTIFIIGGAVLLVIFFLIARLAVRWAVRLTIVGVILIAILGAGGFWWWSNSLTAKSRPNRPQPTPAKRTPAR